MEAIALHDFHATADDELSFKKGSVLKVTTMFKTWYYRVLDSPEYSGIKSFGGRGELEGFKTAWGRYLLVSGKAACFHSGMVVFLTTEVLKDLMSKVSAIIPPQLHLMH